MDKPCATVLAKHSHARNAMRHLPPALECDAPELANHSGRRQTGGKASRPLNVIGPAVIRLRSERGWTQEILAAHLQCRGEDVSREMVANIESGRTQITDRHISAFQKVFGVRVILLFPKAVQELDEKLASREAASPLIMPGRRKP